MKQPQEPTGSYNSSSMDRERIFSMFNPSGSNEEESSMRVLTLAKKEAPSFKLALFTKLIFNRKRFSGKVERLMEDTPPDGGIPMSAKDLGKALVFNQAWNCIEGIDIHKLDHLEAIFNYKGPLYDALEVAIRYFEKEEDYEKCAFLYKLQKLIENPPEGADFFL